jgi:shikimate kinase
MNLVLTGYRCSGKSSVGRILAARLGMVYCDTDALVEDRTGKNIKTLVSEYGWDHFRDEEKVVVECLARMDDRVIATGGGVILNSENIKSLKANGWFAWLKTGPRVLEKRMRKAQKNGSTRPSLSGADPVDEIGRVLEERAPSYAEAADFVVDTEPLSPEEVAEEIGNAFEKSRGV